MDKKYTINQKNSPTGEGKKIVSLRHMRKSENETKGKGMILYEKCN